jgi:hypothetical protein
MAEAGMELQRISLMDTPVWEKEFTVVIKQSTKSKV